MAKLVDPLQRLTEERQEKGELSAAHVARARRWSPTPAVRPLSEKELPGTTLEQRVKADFRVFLTLVWRHLLGNDPNPIQLDLAYWLQHGPDRAIIMAHRGFSKSWITGAYAVWRLYCDPDEKVMVVSGGLVRAQATSSWCLSLVMTMDLLKELRPKTSNRQSATMWDVGNCIPAQSASFTAFGIGGQLVGFRGSLIIPDDVETQQNSLTVVMRDKIREAVKEFESVLTPGGQIKYLGTPHDVDSLYLYLLSLKNEDGSKVYQARIWPALFPTEEQIRKYNGLLAPYVLHEIQKQGPSCVGHSTMPMRFPDSDLAKRKAAMGNSEFLLQFMLDLSGSFLDKYPLKLRDLMVMDLDGKKAPEEVVWGTTAPDRDLPIMGFDGDYYHKPVHVGDYYGPYDNKVAVVDSSGRGSNETVLQIGGTIAGRVDWLHMFASKDGYGPETLKAIAKACVRFRVSKLVIEANFGDGMFTALVKPVLQKAVEDYNRKRPKGEEELSIGVEEISSGKAQKEKRILSVLEPLTQQHRLLVNRAVIDYDYRSINEMDGEDTRRYYAWGYQYTHLTREHECLSQDDRVESLALLGAQFADVLGVDPLDISKSRADERQDRLLRELEEDEWDAVGRPQGGREDTRVEAAKPSKR